MRSGSNFTGSSEVQTSVANEEIIPKDKRIYKFSIAVTENCTASINGSDPIFIAGGSGFSTNQVDAIISSFKILEDGKEFYWIGGY